MKFCVSSLISISIILRQKKTIHHPNFLKGCFKSYIFFYYETLWELKWELKSAKEFIANKKKEDGFPEKKSLLKIDFLGYFLSHIFLNVWNLHFEPIILLLQFYYSSLKLAFSQ